MCRRRSCVFASFGIAQSVPVTGEDRGLEDTHSKSIAVSAMISPLVPPDRPAYGNTLDD